MVITGRIYDIVIVSDKIAKIILKKKDRDKIVPIAITIMGYYKDKALNEMKLKLKDKIKGNIYLTSKLYNGKWYTDVFFREVYLVEPAPIKMVSTLFQTDEGLVDTETGEIM